MSSKPLPVVNCLNCRHCSLLPHSNFSREVVPIHCGKTGRNVPAKLGVCPVADPRTIGSGKDGQRSRSGDRMGRWTPSAVAYLAARYHDEPMERLVATLQRSALTVRTRASLLGLQRAPSYRLATRRSVIKHVNNTRPAQLWPPAQVAAVKQLYASQLWPGSGDRNEKSEEKWRVVLAAINTAGPPRTRKAVRVFINKLPRKERFPYAN